MRTGSSGSSERPSTDAINGSFTMLVEIVLCAPLRHFRTTNLRKIAATNWCTMTHSILNAHRFLTATTAVVALLGWGMYAYSVHSSATRDEDCLEALARTTTDRNRLLSEQQQLVVVQQRLQAELAQANVQHATAREEIASVKPQQKVANKGGLVTVEPQTKAVPTAVAGSDSALGLGEVHRVSAMNEAGDRRRQGAC
jgi:hypothetical protein